MGDCVMEKEAEKSGCTENGRRRRTGAAKGASRPGKARPSGAEESAAQENGAEEKCAGPSACLEEKAATAAPEQPAVPAPEAESVPLEKELSREEAFPSDQEENPFGELDRLRAGLFSEELDQETVERMFLWAREEGAGLPEKERAGEELSGTALLESVRHGRHVAGLLLRIFESASSLHGLDGRWARILAQAALWHDLGFAVGGKRRHHKRSMEIIEKNAYLSLSFGLEEKDRPLVALLARYHRRAWPSLKHRRFAVLSSEDRQSLTRASALLRVADALDFTHRAVVEEVRVRVRRRSVDMVCIGSLSCRRECRRALKKGDLFEKLFDRKLDVTQGKEGDGDGR
ncbi:HD domain-containing protein [Mailhella massiliensis]|uniref:HD domain-containing protein n=1 Tax=Mailhella massiliensis TaxID=1903261 RepID=A0A921DS39_9BACT|nr:HD domain-containing protein [Mailhella massiliensis]HJD96557.1 HD domain-containing protein [Mailhella massiliensis]